MRVGESVMIRGEIVTYVTVTEEVVDCTQSLRWWGQDRPEPGDTLYVIRQRHIGERPTEDDIQAYAAFMVGAFGQ